jgi:hypothetical protein
MATLYGVEAPATGFEQRDLGSSRRGYFTQLPFLIVASINRDPDPIRRGLTLTTDMLCTKLTPMSGELPPIPALEPGQTNRERITLLTEGCGGDCHDTYINPLGFAFESFDGMGQLRALDNGKPVDTSGSYPFTEGTLSFDDAAELMQLMANGRQAHACYAKKIASYSLQRDIVESDLPLIDSLAGVSMDTAGSIKRMLIGLAQSPAFYVRAGGAP